MFNLVRSLKTGAGAKLKIMSLENYGVQELNRKQTSEIEGGFLLMLLRALIAPLQTQYNASEFRKGFDETYGL